VPDTSTCATLSVNRYAPGFSSLTASQTVTYGQASIAVSGTLSAPGPLYPPVGETIAITLNGVATNASLGANGAFSASLDIHSLSVAGGPYAITYSYAGMSTCGRT